MARKIQGKIAGAELFVHISAGHSCEVEEISSYLELNVTLEESRSRGLCRYEEGVSWQGDEHSTVLELYLWLFFVLKLPDGAAGWSISPARPNACPRTGTRAPGTKDK